MKKYWVAGALPLHLCSTFKMQRWFLVLCKSTTNQRETYGGYGNIISEKHIFQNVQVYTAQINNNNNNNERVYTTNFNHG